MLLNGSGTKIWSELFPTRPRMVQWRIPRVSSSRRASLDVLDGEGHVGAGRVLFRASRNRRLPGRLP